MIDMDRFEQKKIEIIEGIRVGAFCKAGIVPEEKMYHYTSIAGLKGILESRTFQATEYHFLNDEDEFFYSDELLLEVVDEEFNGCDFYHHLKIAIEEFCITYRVESEDAANSYYVVSFSKKPDNLTLWSEFASCGCNMELLPLEMFQEIEALRFQGFVRYDRQEQKEELKEAIRMILEHYTELNFNSDVPLSDYFVKLDEQEIHLIAELFVRLASYYGMAMKKEQFAAEEEYRLIFEVAGKEVKYRQKGALFLPYIELSLKWQDNFPALSGVTLAPLNRGDMNKYPMNHFLQSLGLGRCCVRESGMRLRY